MKILTNFLFVIKIKEIIVDTMALITTAINHTTVLAIRPTASCNTNQKISLALVQMNSFHEE